MSSKCDRTRIESELEFIIISNNPRGEFIQRLVEESTFST